MEGDYMAYWKEVYTEICRTCAPLKQWDILTGHNCESSLLTIESLTECNHWKYAWLLNIAFRIPGALAGGPSGSGPGEPGALAPSAGADALGIIAGDCVVAGPVGVFMEVPVGRWPFKPMLRFKLMVTFPSWEVTDVFPEACRAPLGLWAYKVPVKHKQ